MVDLKDRKLSCLMHGTASLSELLLTKSKNYLDEIRQKSQKYQRIYLERNFKAIIPITECRQWLGMVKKAFTEYWYQYLCCRTSRRPTDQAIRGNLDRISRIRLVPEMKSSAYYGRQADRHPLRIIKLSILSSLRISYMAANNFASPCPGISMI